MPYVKNIYVVVGFGFFLFCYLVIVGASIAVYLSDGLDGLAIMPTVLVAGALGVFAYVAGNVKFATFLDIPYVQGVGEVAVLCGALVWASLGFLWFFSYPAQEFMGVFGV